MTDYMISQLPTVSTMAADYLTVMVDPSDTSTPPAGANGSDKKVPLSQLLPGVLWPSGDATGVKDAASINAALGAGFEYIYLSPAAAWYIECGQITINASGTWIDAPGCLIYAVGSGDMIRMYDSSSIGSRTTQGGGFIGYPIVDGTNTTGNSTPFHAGDIFRLNARYQPQNFTAGTTSKGGWIDNVYLFTEESVIDAVVTNCTENFVFDVHYTGSPSANVTGSFDRGDITVYVNQSNPAFDGVVWQNGALMIDGKLTIRGNFNSSGSSLTSCVLRVTGATPAGAALASDSNIGNSMVDVGVECASGSFTPQTIVFGAGSNQISNCYGQMDFSNGAPFASSNNASNLLNFFGPVTGDVALVSWLEAVLCNSSTGAQAITSTSPAPVVKISGPLVPYQVSKIRAWVPYSSSVAVGTPKFAFTGPGGQLVTNIVVKFYSGGALSSVSLYTDYTSTFTGPTLTSSTAHLMEIEGTVLGSVAGALQLTAWEGTVSDAFTIEAGAYMSIIQSNY